MKTQKIGVLVGSARKGAYSRAVAETITAMLPEGYAPSIISIADLPMFNQDYDDEGSTPAEWKRFRKDIAEADAYLFVTPEHNRSFPALLKNALDIASRPYGQNVWSGKPAAIVSVSPGAIGGMAANHHLRQVLSFLNMYTMQQPECYVSNIASALDDKGTVTDGKTVAFLKSFADAYAHWVAKF